MQPWDEAPDQRIAGGTVDHRASRHPWLFGARLGVRLIALASSPDIARRALTDAWVELMQHAPVRPLAYCRDEIDKLIGRRSTIRRARPHFQTTDLTRANQEAPKIYHWPGNFDELRLIADGIIAHTTLGGLRSAAPGALALDLAVAFCARGAQVPAVRLIARIARRSNCLINLARTAIARHALCMLRHDLGGLASGRR